MSDVQRAKVGPYRWDDFLALPDDDRRELIDGELVEVEVPNRAHERIVMMLGYYLVGYGLKRGFCVLASGYKFRISDVRGVMPDVQLFRAENHPSAAENEGLVHGRPDLAVEIISPSSRRYDRILKLGYYLERKVPEYWIVDPENETLDRYVYSRRGYVLASAHAGAEIFKPDSFPGLRIPLAKLWTLPTAPPKKKAAAKRRRVRS